tara:strand:+ start:1409 stop:2119 length:711 start_codon:yes stop_codon:yes gene_type:complete
MITDEPSRNTAPQEVLWGPNLSHNDHPMTHEEIPENPLKVKNDTKIPIAIIVENFYEDVDEVRKFALSKDFSLSGNYPGRRTKSFTTEDIKNFLQDCVYPFGGKLTYFNMDGDDPQNANGSFQYTLSFDKSWMHTDGYTNWGALVYLTPDAPISAGTGLFRYESGERWAGENLEDRVDFGNISQDKTKWEQVDNFGNVYNRLIIFNSKHYHTSLDYFGSDVENGRLFQVFFFRTER